MGYTVFERKFQRVNAPMVSVQRMGRLVLNKLAAAILTEQGSTSVLVMWDEENRRFALRPIFKKDPRAYQLRFTKAGKAGNVDVATVSAKTFLDSIGYDYKETRQYPATWNEHDGLLEVSLPGEHFKAMPQQKVLGFPGPRSHRTTA